MNSALETTVPAPQARRVVFLLFLAMFLNYYDRTIPAVLMEPIRLEFGLTDTLLGLLNAVFTVTYALFGIVLGRLADVGVRKTVMGMGLIAWSAATALSGAATGFGWFLLARVGVGIGEASCAPTAQSIVADLYAPERRSRAMGLVMLGLPLGLVAAFFTGGAIASAMGSWHAVFWLAALPGALLGGIMLMMKEPPRQAAPADAASGGIAQALRLVWAVASLRWLTLGAIGFGLAGYVGTGFMVALLQRYFHLPLIQAGIVSGVIIGATGLVAMIGGGWLADVLQQRWRPGRLGLTTLASVAGAVLTLIALCLPSTRVEWFVVLFAIGWLATYLFPVCAYPALQEVVAPRQRGVAMAVHLAVGNVVGGGCGVVLVGVLSDRVALASAQAAGQALDEYHRGVGLATGMLLIPAAMALMALATWQATRHFDADRQRAQDAASSLSTPH
ncbi:MAG: MFS transporter [Rhodoferax sp.]|uniref:spinster family MFS transporter n=1 Tax=Rhodoferax sp. TaxID=50421 RepID=UPI00271612D0|nr:MFS transporter [Rhodoferax sp.]MDO8449442.1 MFS transporter [Rhodoferax sp.]